MSAQEKRSLRSKLVTDGGMRIPISTPNTLGDPHLETDALLCPRKESPRLC